MKFMYRKLKNEILLEDVGAGSLFKFEGEIYIKLYKNSRCTTMRLPGGAAINLDYQDKVVPLKNVEVFYEI